MQNTRKKNSIFSKAYWGYRGNKDRKTLSPAEATKTESIIQRQIGPAAVATVSGGLTNVAFGAAVGLLGAGTIGATAGVIIPSLAAAVMVGGLVYERIARVENLKITITIIMNECKEYIELYKIMLNEKPNLQINADAFILSIKEIIVYMLSITSENEINALPNSRLSNVNNTRGTQRVSGLLGVFKRLGMYINPNEFNSILLAKLTRVTSSFTIIFAKYTLSDMVLSGGADAPTLSDDEINDEAQKILKKIMADMANSPDPSRSIAVAGDAMATATNEALNPSNSNGRNS